jgi:hypothetical protein
LLGFAARQAGKGFVFGKEESPAFLKKSSKKLFSV